MLSRGAQKLALTTHVALSVGWLGAVLTSVTLAIAGIVSDDRQVVRSVYPALEVVGWYALVPLSVASLASGLVQALGTRWGLFRHYWVLAKLVLNVLAVVVLLLYMQTLSDLADRAGSATTGIDELRDASPVVHGVAALVLLIAATVLSVYKPQGLTRYGHRQSSVAVPPP